MRLLDSELKVLEVLWEKGPMPASQLYRILEEKVGWNKNTTYTVLKKSIIKGLIDRQEPKFVCHPLISREEAQNKSLLELMKRLFHNSKSELFQAFVRDDTLSEDEIKELKDLVDRLK